MKDNREEIRPYVADMAAVERHILEALERQRKDDTFKDFPQALGIIDRLAGLLETHVENLETHLDSIPGGGVAAAVKETVTGVLGGLAGALLLTAALNNVQQFNDARTYAARPAGGHAPQR